MSSSTSPPTPPPLEEASSSATPQAFPSPRSGPTLPESSEQQAHPHQEGQQPQGADYADLLDRVSAKLREQGHLPQANALPAAESATAAQNRTGPGQGVGNPHPELSEESTSLEEELMGRAKAVCNILSWCLAKSGPSAVAIVLPEIIKDLIGLMMDSTGWQLIWDILLNASEDQRLQVLAEVFQKEAVVRLACDEQGSLALSRLIECIREFSLPERPQQAQLMALALQPEVPEVGRLIRDRWGHMVLLCWQWHVPTDSQYLHNAVEKDAVRIACHPVGHKVLQHYITAAKRSSDWGIPHQIAEEALALSKTCLRVTRSTQDSTSDLKLIIQDLVESPDLPDLLQDPDGRLVIQTALDSPEDDLHTAMATAIYEISPPALYRFYLQRAFAAGTGPTGS